MRKPVLLLATLLLAACGAPPTATPDLVGTQISLAVVATQIAEGVAATRSATAAGPTSAPTPALPTLPPPAATSPPGSACPLPGNPSPPPRPASFADYPGTLEAYLSAGAGPAQLETLLRDWGAITADMGVVWPADMTGDNDLEIAVSLIDPAPEAEAGPWPAGDVLIFQCQAGSVRMVYQGRFPAEEDWSWYSFHLDQVGDVNRNGLFDLVYWTSTCGAHTCFDQLYVVEWDGTSWINRVPDMDDYPYPTFTASDGQILVDSVGFGSVGAGIQRGYREIWIWAGDRFVFQEEIVQPPLALIHYMHDGDAALTMGSYAEAIAHYQSALTDADLPSGLFPDEGPEATAIVRAYARLKLVVAWAADGDQVTAGSHYNLLVQEHPQGTPGHPFALLGQVFWTDLQAHGDPRLACAAVTAAAQSDPAPAEILYAGYGNPAYEPEGLCALP